MKRTAANRSIYNAQLDSAILHMKETTGAAMVEPKGTKTALLNETKLLRKRQNQLRKTALKPMRHRWHDRSDEGGEGIADGDDDDDDDDHDEGWVGGKYFEETASPSRYGSMLWHPVIKASDAHLKKDFLGRSSSEIRLDIPKSPDAPDVARFKFSLTRRETEKMPKPGQKQSSIQELIAANPQESSAAQKNQAGEGEERAVVQQQQQQQGGGGGGGAAAAAAAGGNPSFKLKQSSSSGA